MRPNDVMRALTDGLGFVLEETQFRPDSFIIRRPSLNPAYKTEYCQITMDGEMVTVIGCDGQCDIFLADPMSIDQLVAVVNNPGFLMGSYRPLDAPMATRLF
jgi:hypothetical protein